MESAVNQDETITSSRADDVELNIERETFIQMEGNPSQEYLDNITSDFWDNDPESKRSRRKQGMPLKRTKNDDIGLKDNDTEIDIYKFDEELHFLEGTSDQELSSEQMDITGQHKKSRKQFKPCRVTSEQKSDDADNEYLSEDDNDDEPAEVMETIFKIIEKLSTSGVKQSDDDEISRKRRRKMKKYQCSLCSFNTKDSYTLGQHMRWHIGDRPYVCRGCSKDFTRADHLRRHVEGAHPGQLDYFLRCIYEDYNAKLKETFLSHVNDSPSLDTLLTTSVMKSGMQTPTSIGLVSHITNSSEQSSTLQEANSVANVKFHRNKPIKVEPMSDVKGHMPKQLLVVLTPIDLEKECRTLKSLDSDIAEHGKGEKSSEEWARVRKERIHKRLRKKKPQRCLSPPRLNQVSSVSSRLLMTDLSSDSLQPPNLEPFIGIHNHHKFETHAYNDTYLCEQKGSTVCIINGPKEHNQKPEKRDGMTCKDNTLKMECSTLLSDGRIVHVKENVQAEGNDNPLSSPEQPVHSTCSPDHIGFGQNEDTGLATDSESTISTEKTTADRCQTTDVQTEQSNTQMDVIDILENEFDLDSTSKCTLYEKSDSLSSLNTLSQLQSIAVGMDLPVTLKEQGQTVQDKHVEYYEYNEKSSSTVDPKAMLANDNLSLHELLDKKAEHLREIDSTKVDVHIKKPLSAKVSDIVRIAAVIKRDICGHKQHIHTCRENLSDFQPEMEFTVRSKNFQIGCMDITAKMRHNSAGQMQIAYECPNCHLLFASYKGLNFHYRRKHKENEADGNSTADNESLFELKRPTAEPCDNVTSPSLASPVPASMYLEKLAEANRFTRLQHTESVSTNVQGETRNNAFADESTTAEYSVNCFSRFSDCPGTKYERTQLQKGHPLASDVQLLFQNFTHQHFLHHQGISHMPTSVDRESSVNMPITCSSQDSDPVDLSKRVSIPVMTNCYDSQISQAINVTTHNTSMFNDTINKENRTISDVTNMQYQMSPRMHLSNTCASAINQTYGNERMVYTTPCRISTLLSRDHDATMITSHPQDAIPKDDSVRISVGTTQYIPKSLIHYRPVMCDDLATGEKTINVTKKQIEQLQNQIMQKDVCTNEEQKQSGVLDLSSRTNPTPAHQHVSQRQFIQQCEQTQKSTHPSPIKVPVIVDSPFQYHTSHLEYQLSHPFNAVTHHGESSQIRMPVMKAMLAQETLSNLPVQHTIVETKQDSTLRSKPKVLPPAPGRPFSKSFFSKTEQLTHSSQKNVLTQNAQPIAFQRAFQNASNKQQILSNVEMSPQSGALSEKSGISPQQHLSVNRVATTPVKHFPGQLLNVGFEQYTKLQEQNLSRQIHARMQQTDISQGTHLPVIQRQFRFPQQANIMQMHDQQLVAVESQINKRNASEQQLASPGKLSSSMLLCQPLHGAISQTQMVVPVTHPVITPRDNTLIQCKPDLSKVSKEINNMANIVNRLPPTDPLSVIHDVPFGMPPNNNDGELPAVYAKVLGVSNKVRTLRERDPERTIIYPPNREPEVFQQVSSPLDLSTSARAQHTSVNEIQSESLSLTDNPLDLTVKSNSITSHLPTSLVLGQSTSKLHQGIPLSLSSNNRSYISRNKVSNVCLTDIQGDLQCNKYNQIKNVPRCMNMLCDATQSPAYRAITDQPPIVITNVRSLSEYDPQAAKKGQYSIHTISRQTHQEISSASNAALRKRNVVASTGSAIAMRASTKHYYPPVAHSSGATARTDCIPQMSEHTPLLKVVHQNPTVTTSASLNQTVAHMSKATNPMHVMEHVDEVVTSCPSKTSRSSLTSQVQSSITQMPPFQMVQRFTNRTSNPDLFRTPVVNMTRSFVPTDSGHQSNVESTTPNTQPLMVQTTPFCQQNIIIPSNDMIRTTALMVSQHKSDSIASSHIPTSCVSVPTPVKAQTVATRYANSVQNNVALEPYPRVAELPVQPVLNSGMTHTTSSACQSRMVPRLASQASPRPGVLPTSYPNTPLAGSLQRFAVPNTTMSINVATLPKHQPDNATLFSNVTPQDDKRNQSDQIPVSSSVAVTRIIPQDKQLSPPQTQFCHPITKQMIQGNIISSSEKQVLSQTEQANKSNDTLDGKTTIKENTSKDNVDRSAILVSNLGKKRSSSVRDSPTPAEVTTKVKKRRITSYNNDATGTKKSDPSSDSEILKSFVKSGKHKCPFCFYSDYSRKELRIHIKLEHFNKQKKKYQEQEATIGAYTLRDQRKNSLERQASEISETSQVSEMTADSLEDSTDESANIDERTDEINHPKVDLGNAYIDYTICSKCKVQCSSPSDLQDHYNVVHKLDNKESQCSLCGFTSPHSDILQQHMEVCQAEKPFQCKYIDCGRSFATPEDIQRHSRRHDDDKKFGCDLCGAKYHWQNGLRAHMQRHTMNYPYECRHCGLKFKTSGMLKRHEYEKKHFFPEDSGKSMAKGRHSKTHIPRESICKRGRRKMHRK